MKLKSGCLLCYVVVISMVMFAVQDGYAAPGEEVLYKNSTDKIYLDLDTPSEPQMPSMYEMAVKMLVSLFVVLGLVILTLYLIKKYFPNTGGGRDPALKLARIIEKLPVSQKHSIYLVWAVDRLLVLGVCGNSMNLLSEIKDQNVLQDKMPAEFSDTLTRANLSFSEIYNA